MMAEAKKHTYYKYCIVPMCPSTSVKTPSKHFFYIPRDINIRKKWCEVMKRGLIGPISSKYVCEDHFDIEKDTDNLIKYRLVGGSLRLKRNIHPHKFECQEAVKNLFTQEVPSTSNQSCSFQTFEMESAEMESNETGDPLPDDITYTDSLPDDHVNKKKSKGVQDNNLMPLMQPAPTHHGPNCENNAYLKMEELCRLCLTLSSPLSLQYLSSAVTQKVETALPVQIIDNDFLPKNVCSSCIQKIDEILEFHLKVAANQNLLLRYLNEGVNSLNEFYLTLTNNLIVKFETETKDKNNQGLESDINKTISIKQEKDDETNDSENIIYTKIHIENEQSIKKEVFVDTDDIYSDQSNPATSEDSIKKEIVKEKIPAKGKKEKSPDNGKEDIVLSKRRKMNTHQPKPPDGRKVINHKITTETDNNTEDNDKHNDLADKNYQNDRFKCLTCFNLFNNKDDLINHYRNDHMPLENEPEKKQCTYSQLKDKEEIIFKCDQCEYKHHIRWYVQRHVKSHTDKRPFNCKICGRTYKTALEIYIHGRAHTTAKLECFYQCGFTTAYKGALKNHEMVHRAEYRHTCNKCQSGFHTRIQLIEHENKHQGVRPFVCDICGYAFHMRRYLQAHRSRLHPQSSTMKRYLCVHCSLPCDTMNALNEHMKAKHEKRTDFLCDVCGKTLKCKEKLTAHKRMHLGVKPFECNICGKKLTKKSTLIIHINGHTKERFFKCQCGKKYTQQSALNRHLRTKCPQFLDDLDASNYSNADGSQEAESTVKGKEELSS